MEYKIIKIQYKNSTKYKFEIHINLGEHIETIRPHFGYLTEEKAVREAQKEIRRQEKEVERVRIIAKK